MTMLARLSDEAIAQRITAQEHLLKEANAMLAGKLTQKQAERWRKNARNASAALGRLRAELRRRAKASNYVPGAGWGEGAG
jgi:hypothetical protein